MTITPNLSLPYIDVNAAQREVVHNEAIRALDALVQLSVLDRSLATPPGSPANGQRWLVAGSPIGDWAGHANHVAAWQDGAWRFFAPRTGWLVFVIDEGLLLVWNGSAWVGALEMIATLQNVALLGVGTTADTSNPFSAKFNNALWVAETVGEGGDGHLRFKLSKENATKTLSLLMQNNFSGRAEIGLTGDDDLRVKVSSDGSTWHEGLSIARSSGQVRLGIDGTEAAPALAFASDTDNGAYRIGANNWALSAGGTKVVDLSTTAVGIAANVINLGAATINFNSVDAGVIGPSLITLHDSVSPAANDTVYRAIHDGRDAVGTDTVYGMYEVIISSPTNGAEAGFIQWRTVQAGTLAPRMSLKTGLVLGSPTGDDKGQGSLNCKDAYNDDVALTCFGVEYLVDGAIDVAKWDRYHCDGHNPIVHRFAEMVKEFDPRDPVSYVSKMKADRALPGMPTEREWGHNRLSIGSMHNRLWLSTELLASAFAGQVALTQNLERRLAALEARTR